MAAITEGDYYLVTEVDGVKYFVTTDGGLTEFQEDGAEFYISQVDASSANDKLFDVAILIEPGTGSHFTNTTLINDKAKLHPGSFCLNANHNRNDWERQIFYLNDSGKFAIRSCNTVYGEIGWNDAGRTFWTFEVDETNIPTPCYSYDPAYVWMLELSPNDGIITINGINYIIYNDNMTAKVTFSPNNEKYSGNVVIPSSINYDGNTYIVSGIGNSAFRDCIGLTSVTIPESITSVGVSAFAGCI